MLNDYTHISKFMSLVLRHDPSAAGLSLDGNGWADVSGLLAGLRAKGFAVDFAVLEQVVETNDKKRFAFNDDKTKIRASQGHSVSVDVELTPMLPPDKLYHGTAERFYESILRAGLQKQSRNYVHLSADAATALAVGKRHGRPVVLVVDAQAMCADGYRFYRSANGVWQTDAVPPRYLSRL